VHVTKTRAGERLDRALPALAPQLSRSRARQLIEGGSVFVDGRRVRVCSRTVSEGQRIVCHELAAPAEAGEPRIVTLETDFAVIDKPTRMAVEPTRQGAKGTLSEWAKTGVPGGALVTHRLDAATSGLIVLARNRETQAALNRMFAAHEVKRTYVAVVTPAPSWDRIKLDEPLDLRPAVTHASVIARSPKGAALVLDLETGRNRQIRRHLSLAGHPVLGDLDAGGQKAARLLLHAVRLSFTWKGRPCRYEAGVPPAWTAELDRLGFTVPSLEALLPSV